jgi:hypothetical protein
MIRGACPPGAEAIEALSRERALLLVLEDLHWSDAATLDVLAWLARRREPARLLFIGTYRPVDVILGGHPLRAVKQELARQRCCVDLAVELLTAAEVTQYLSARFPVQVPHGATLGEVATVIHRRTDGHPLFMVTLVDYLVQRGWLAAVEGQGQMQTAIAFPHAAAARARRRGCSHRPRRGVPESPRLGPVVSGRPRRRSAKEPRRHRAGSRARPSLQSDSGAVLGGSTPSVLPGCQRRPGARAGGHGSRHCSGLCPATGARALVARLGADQAGASRRGHCPDASGTRWLGSDRRPAIAAILPRSAG